MRLCSFIRAENGNIFNGSLKTSEEFSYDIIVEAGGLKVESVQDGGSLVYKQPSIAVNYYNMNGGSGVNEWGILRVHDVMNTEGSMFNAWSWLEAPASSISNLKLVLFPTGKTVLTDGGDVAGEQYAATSFVARGDTNEAELYVTTALFYKDADKKNTYNLYAFCAGKAG